MDNICPICESAKTCELSFCEELSCLSCRNCKLSLDQCDDREAISCVFCREKTFSFVYSECPKAYFGCKFYIYACCDCYKNDQLQAYWEERNIFCQFCQNRLALDGGKAVKEAE